MSMPDVSVVMSVYNGGQTLEESIDSILCQKNVNFEFIIINDGSRDETPTVLERAASKDHRVRIIHQENTGLTKALIHGCEAAKGRFIARQDAGDVSMPGRLKKQMDLLADHPEAGFASCGTRFIDRNKLFLFDVIQDPQRATRALLTLDIKEFQGPSSHGSIMFSADRYRKVGGYRWQFKMAQDIDLLVRLAEIGPHMVMEEILYQAEFTVGSISAGASKIRQKLGELILECANKRRNGEPEDALLETVAGINIRGGVRSGRRNSEAAYFIGSCLRHRNKKEARRYFKQAIYSNPLHFKALYRYLF